MSQLPENRSINNTRQEHVDDHNELHRVHNLLEPIAEDLANGAVTAEQVQDIVGAMATDGATVNFSYNDELGTFTAEVQGLSSGNLSDFAEAVRDRLAATLVAGTGITVTTDDPGDTVTVAVQAGTYVGIPPVTVVAASGAAQTLDCDGGYAVFDVTETADCTYTFDGAVNGRECVITLIRRQDGTGNRVPTFPASVRDAPGTSLIRSTDPGLVDEEQFRSTNGGTTWRHSMVGSGYPSGS